MPWTTRRRSVRAVDDLAQAEAERALRDSEERRWHEARHDPLTGLPNRLGLTEQLARVAGPGRAGRHDRAVPARPGPVPRAQRHPRAGRRRPAAGHGRGTAVRARRRAAAGPARRRRVRAAVAGRRPDLVSAATTLLDALAGAPLQVGPTPLTVTASAGLTERRVAGLDVDELLRSADIALTWAKSDGRNRWRRFDPVRNAADTARWSLAAELPAAVRDGGLEAALPADGRAGRRPAARRRGAGPVEPPAAGAVAARAVHRRRRGDRPGRAAGPAGARHRLRRGRVLGPADPGSAAGQRQPRRRPAARPRAGRGRGRHPRRDRASRRPGCSWSCWRPRSSSPRTRR